MEPAVPSSEISPYDRLYWSDDALLRALASGEHRRELTLYLGAERFEQCVALLRSAHFGAPGVRPVVWLIPGIMGSQLGLPRDNGHPPDLIWLDPMDVMRGDLYKLRWSGPSAVRVLGLVHHSYLGLWLRLLAAGFHVRVFPYDWRCGIAQLGAALATRLRTEETPVAIVAHSLGGLVARAALTDAAANARVQRIVLLGTPNNGAAAARLALNGCYPVVRRAAMLDRRHDAQQLATDVFATFGSVQQLLPENRERAAALAPSDERHVAIAGTGQITCLTAMRDNNHWRYRYGRRGDGTVPLVSAQLAGARCHVAETEHSELARDALVASAIVELLERGRTDRLPTSEPEQLNSGDRDEVLLGHDELSGQADGKIDWAGLTADQRRQYLEQLNAPLPIPALAGL